MTLLTKHAILFIKGVFILKQEVLKAIISAIITTGTASLIGWFTKFKFKEKNDFLKKQLTTFYSPLYKLILSSKNGEITKEFWVKFDDICNQYPEFVPASLSKFQQYDHLKDNTDELDELKKHIFVNNKYLEKHFKISHEKLKSEEYKYLDNYKNKNLFASLLQNFIPLILVLPLIISLVMRTKTAFYIALSASGYGAIFFLIMSYIKKWSD